MGTEPATRSTAIDYSSVTAPTMLWKSKLLIPCLKLIKFTFKQTKHFQLMDELSRIIIFTITIVTFFSSQSVSYTHHWVHFFFHYIPIPSVFLSFIETHYTFKHISPPQKPPTNVPNSTATAVTSACDSSPRSLLGNSSNEMRPPAEHVEHK